MADMATAHVVTAHMATDMAMAVIGDIIAIGAAAPAAIRSTPIRSAGCGIDRIRGRYRGPQTADKALAKAGAF